MTDAKIIETAAKQAGSVRRMTSVCLLRNALVAAAWRHGVTNGKI